MVNLTQSYFSGQSTPPAAQQPSTSTTPTPTPVPSESPQPVPKQVCNANRILDIPAVRFLLRSDFFNLLHLNDEALMQYNSSPTLKHMVTKMRREGSQSPPVTTSFERYQHNRDLVSLINKFADTTRPLPTGLFTVQSNI